MNVTLVLLKGMQPEVLKPFWGTPWWFSNSDSVFPTMCLGSSAGPKKITSRKCLCVVRGKSHFVTFARDTKNIRQGPSTKQQGNLLFIFLPSLRVRWGGGESARTLNIEEILSRPEWVDKGESTTFGTPRKGFLAYGL